MFLSPKDTFLMYFVTVVSASSHRSVSIWYEQNLGTLIESIINNIEENGHIQDVIQYFNPLTKKEENATWQNMVKEHLRQNLFLSMENETYDIHHFNVIEAPDSSSDDESSDSTGSSEAGSAESEEGSTDTSSSEEGSADCTSSEGSADYTSSEGSADCTSNEGSADCSSNNETSSSDSEVQQVSSEGRFSKLLTFWNNPSQIKETFEEDSDYEN